MYTAGSLFTGIGGIDLAFSRAGFDVRWQVEIEPFCRAVLTKHSARYWPNAVQHEDVKNVGRHNLESVDVIFGGFPCQDISSAGRKAGIKKGNRSGLWFEFARVISELRPRCVLLENVPAIVGRGSDIVLGALSEVGYDAEWGIIPASAVGAPHKRDRWWCVAFPNPKYIRCNRASIESRDGSALCRPSQGQESAQQFEGICTSSSLAHSNRLWESQSEGCQCEGRRWAEHSSETMGNPTNAGLSQPRQSELSSMETQTSSRLVIQPERSGKGQAQSIMGRAVDGVSRQLDRAKFPAYQGQRQYEWEAARTITSKLPNRAARLKALGNAVVPQVVQPIAEAIYAVLKEEDSQVGAA